MATVTRPAPTAAPTAVKPAPVKLFRRPTGYQKGLWGWITTVDHKKIGLMYAVTAGLFFLLGGLEAMLLRWQLGTPESTFLSADMYNQIFTMHGTTMIFLVIMPLSAGFANYLLPLMIGARDVAFPRLNALGYWVFLVGGLFMYSSFFLGGMPNGGWFGYTPLTEVMPGHNIDYWVFGLQILGIASLSGAVNLIVTVINMRAPGMSLMRMPVFVWMSLVAQFLLLFAIPIITVALFLLSFDRMFSTNFFVPAAGGDPLLWQHLFWLFGHPEVYILILPAMGIVSEILPVFSRKPLFGYAVMVFSGIAIGLMGWGVWVHHMFATGLGPVALSAFAASTMFIAVPTGVKIFNWISTMWGGKIKLTSPMLFAIGFVAMFTIGGLSGVTHAVVPSDTQQTDTYYIVAHFHYVLFGGSMFGLFGGAYYWWPKFSGHMLNDKIGKIHFWIMLIGFNLTFGPFHILGLQGMPRRIYTYPEGKGWDFWNFAATIGSFLIALSVLVFIVQHVGQPQEPARRRRPLGRPHAGVVDPVAAAGVQLRRDPPGHRQGRPLAPQVHRGRRGQGGPAGGAHARGRGQGAGRPGRGRRPRPRRAGGPPRRGAAPHPPAVAVVLAGPHRPGPADHRLRDDLQGLRGGGPGRGLDLRLHLRLGPRAGHRAARSRTATATTTAPTTWTLRTKPPHPPRPDRPARRRPSSRLRTAREHDRHPRRPGVGRPGAGRPGPGEHACLGGRPRRAGPRGPPAHLHRPQPREGGHVGVPRLGVPALRGPDLHLPAVQGPERARARSPPSTCSTSRTRRSARSSC